MSSDIHQLSNGDLAEISGGCKYTPPAGSIPPSAITLPPVWHGPVSPPRHDPRIFDGELSLDK